MPRLTHLQGALLVLGSGVVFSFGGITFRATDDIGALATTHKYSSSASPLETKNWAFLKKAPCQRN